MSYEGDPKKILTENGSTLQATDGSFLRDSGIENGIAYSLFVTRHFANIFAINKDQVLESRFEELHNESVTVTNLLDIEDAAVKSLQWMVTKGILSEVEASTIVDEYGIRHTTIIVRPPGGSKQEFIASKYAVNWQFQIKNPASQKVTIKRW